MSTLNRYLIEMSLSIGMRVRKISFSLKKCGIIQKNKAVNIVIKDLLLRI